MTDLEACLAMDRDPEVVRFIDGPWSDPEPHRAFVEARIKARYPRGLGYWTIRRKSEERLLGWILLIPYTVQDAEVEIGWRLVRDAWGQGIAAEAAAAVLRHGFAAVGLDEVVADIDPANLGSIRVAEKIGMQARGAIDYEGRKLVRYGATARHEQADRMGSP